MSTTTPSGTELQTLLDEAPQRVWWRRSMVWIGLAIALVIGAGVYYWQSNAKSSAAPVFVTEPAN